MILQNLWIGSYFEPTDIVAIKPRAIIVDIDGTLSNSDHREYLLNHGRRDEYFDQVSYDDLNEWCKDLIDRYKQDHVVLLLTGRPERVRAETVNWLDLHNVHYDALIMRGEDDCEQGFIYKQKILQTRLEPNFDVKMIVDNDPDICEAFRNLGIPALEYQQEGGVDD